MSTILQALKRLEQEQPSRQGGALNTDPQGFDPRHVLQLSVQRSRWRRPAVMGSAVVLLVLVLYGGALLYMRQRPSDEPLITQRQQTTAIAMDRREQRVAAPDVATRPPTAPSAFDPDLTPQMPTGRIAGDSPPRRTDIIASGEGPLPPAVDGLVRPAPAPIPDTFEARMDKASAAVADNGSDPFAATVTGDGRTTDTNPYVGAAPLQDERLKVQAIVWSPNANDRMAVINNRVVREGMVVDGFAVVAIGEAAIYFRESDRLWQVRFGSP